MEAEKRSETVGFRHELLVVSHNLFRKVAKAQAQSRSIGLLKGRRNYEDNEYGNWPRYYHS